MKQFFGKALNLASVKWSVLTAKYSAINLPHALDQEFYFTEQRKLEFGMPLYREHIYVRCASNNKVFHFFLPILKPSAELIHENTRKRLNLPQSGLSVLLLGLDSMSRLNFQRQLPITGE